MKGLVPLVLGQLQRVRVGVDAGDVPATAGGDVDKGADVATDIEERALGDNTLDPGESLFEDARINAGAGLIVTDGRTDVVDVLPQDVPLIVSRTDEDEAASR